MRGVFQRCIWARWRSSEVSGTEGVVVSPSQLLVVVAGMSEPGNFSWSVVVVVDDGIMFRSGDKECVISLDAVFSSTVIGMAG